MEVHLTADLEKKLNDVAAQTGRGAEELAQEVLAGYLDELAGVREMLDSRYDGLKDDSVKPIDGEEAFARLRQKSKDRRSRPT